MELIYKILLAIIVILIGINAFCFAEEKQVENNCFVYIHLHPILLLEGADLIYLTIEIPTSPSHSFILKPSLWNNVTESKIKAFGSNTKWFRIGTDLGIRYYTNGKGNGLYLQGTVGLFHRKSEGDKDYTQNYYQSKPKRNSFFEADIMGYIGISMKPKKTKFSIFYDTGIGYGSRAFPGVVEGNNIRIDMNFGLGYGF
ncbi:MAG: hypothetical protein FWG85_06690 [Bacteroidetes bacterium]|nr:hypothetical protein [Bacteroidota bacterium]